MQLKFPRLSSILFGLEGKAYAAWFSSQAVASFYVGVTSFAIALCLGRMLGPDSFGRYTLVLTLISFFHIVQNGGYKLLLLRETAKASDGWEGMEDTLFSSATGHVLLLTLAGMAGFLLLAEERWLAWCGVAACLCFGGVSLTDFVSSKLLAANQYHREALWRMVVRTAGGAGLLITLALGGHLVSLFLGWALGVAAALFFSPVRMVKPSPWGALRSVWWRAGLPFILVELGTLVYNRIDILMIDLLGLGKGALGQYAVAYRLLDGVILLATPLGLLLFNAMRKTEDRRSLVVGALRIAGLLASAGVLLAVLARVLGEWGVVLLFGEPFTLAGALVPHLFIALVFVLPNGVLTYALIAANLERVYAAAVVAGAVLNVVLNLILIPVHGIYGAAWATAVTEAGLCAIIVSALCRSARRKRVSP